MSQRHQNKQKTMQAIIVAAHQLIATDGVDATSTRQIAKTAGISYQTLYNYFPTKTSLIRALLNEDLERWNAEVDQLVKRYDGDLVASLLTLCEASATLLMGPQKALWQILAQQNLLHRGDPEQHASFSIIAHEHCYALLSSAHGMGHLHSQLDRHLLAHTLHSLCDYNLLMLQLSPIPIEQFLETQQQQFELLLQPYLRQAPSKRIAIP